MAKGKKGKGHKRGGYRKRVRAASHTLGKLIKAIAVLAPAAAIGVVSYNFFGKGWKAVVPAIMDFSSCFTGVKLGDNGEPVFIPERLIAGWGPVLVIGGITYAEKKIGMAGANPFRVMSQGLG